jgi:acyl carrier protein phosphodiesterase
MNFLAHIYLSGDNEKIRVGNFIGDFVKGKRMNDFDAEISKGIKLHRAIDHFTDTHEVVRESKLKLRSEFRHYSPVIADVFYDHFLARDWLKFSKTPLLDFTEDFYKEIGRFEAIIPSNVTRMVEFMKRDNWLYNYQWTEGIHRSLSGMAKRTTFESKMELATKNLELNYDEYNLEFHKFFPDLQSHCKDFLNTEK